MNREQKLGGLYGLLIGDAVGVPYEFHPAEELPPLHDLEMIPPKSFPRAHAQVLPGTWSDDGAQALCLLESLVECGQLELTDFSQRLWAWYERGLWAVDGHVFDVGVQTAASLRAFHSGASPEQSGNANPDGKGNGSLMRVLPLALWHKGTDEELVKDAHMQSLVTHAHRTNQVACALYCLWVREAAAGVEMEEGYGYAVKKLRAIYGNESEERKELDWSIRPEAEAVSHGGGYVVETLRSVRIATKEPSYEKVVKKAISLGNDTDTNAAIAGGLYGVKTGVSGIPQRWLERLREKEKVEELVQKWIGKMD
ncbi:ADP-ribosylglycohydrolase family protein [Desmospora profundinema]|uniref:ADP-ribosylglycohydrolase n=1 Tax=Desmospora profundinema TaxID=1571184 RepID=A0ABU1IU73_9BACL|nr:ADP-ribosylglycohydrolase family protein [Desmospora profundinema]MDR6227305.1 ADP-ribosylglycohydrolase [Desmospora profundinema]